MSQGNGTAIDIGLGPVQLQVPAELVLHALMVIPGVHVDEIGHQRLAAAQEECLGSDEYKNLSDEESLALASQDPANSVPHVARTALYLTNDQTVTIGREEGNTIQLNDERVSRFHVKIQEDNRQLVLTDLESTNGTRVNDTPVTAHRLLDGDREVDVHRSGPLIGCAAEFKDQIEINYGAFAIYVRCVRMPPRVGGAIHWRNVAPDRLLLTALLLSLGLHTSAILPQA